MTRQITYHAPEHARDAHFFFRYEQTTARTEYLPHRHSWGQVIFVQASVLAIRVDGKRLLTPAGFAVWIPPGQLHASYNEKPIDLQTFNFPAAWCRGLPAEACLLKVGPIVNAIMADCTARQLLTPAADADWRLCEVLLDQLKRAQPLQSYLPRSEDKYLAPVLLALEDNPADNTTLAQWAKRVYTTERTLSRRCQALLGMSFSEWRQRLRFLHAVSKLEQGMPLQHVALDLGYSSASALIVMFQQQSGMTPERYRQRHAQRLISVAGDNSMAE